jgi:hypothetical protein
MGTALCPGAASERCHSGGDSAHLPSRPSENPVATDHSLRRPTPAGWCESMTVRRLRCHTPARSAHACSVVIALAKRSHSGLPRPVSPVGADCIRDDALADHATRLRRGRGRAALPRRRLWPLQAAPVATTFPTGHRGPPRASARRMTSFRGRPRQTLAPAPKERHLDLDDAEDIDASRAELRALAPLIPSSARVRVGRP